MENRPAYSIASVDHALRTSLLLQSEGAMRVMDVADRVGIARSTAHRVLAMLIYRGFATRLDGHLYGPGPVLRRPLATEFASQLRSVAVPRLQRLVAETAETANVGILAGGQIRFLATVECEQALRVGDREGMMLPSHLASAGLAALATLDHVDLVAQLADSPQVDLPEVEHVLVQVRRQGFALNEQATEVGVHAVGVAVPFPGPVPAAVSLGMPSVRYRSEQLRTWVRHVEQAASGIARDLRATTAPPQRAESESGPAVSG